MGRGGYLLGMQVPGMVVWGCGGIWGLGARARGMVVVVVVLGFVCGCVGRLLGMQVPVAVGWGFGGVGGLGANLRCMVGLCCCVCLMLLSEVCEACRP